MSLKIEISRNQGDVILSLEGILDENCMLPEFSEPIEGRLFVDLAKLTMINSMGVRKWVEWMRLRKDIPQGVHLVRCSPVVINQVNILNGFLPSYARVVSFYIPYYCPDCGHEESVLIEVGAAALDSLGAKPCAMCGSVMEMDVVQDIYFKFLNKKAA